VRFGDSLFHRLNVIHAVGEPLNDVRHRIHVAQPAMDPVITPALRRLPPWPHGPDVMFAKVLRFRRYRWPRDWRVRSVLAARFIKATFRVRFRDPPVAVEDFNGTRRPWRQASAPLASHWNLK